MDENTLNEQSMVVITVCIVVVFLVFAPILGDMIIENGWQILYSYFK